MSRARTMLVTGTLLLGGCSVPDTQGLPCEHSDHCNAGQYCSPEQVCVVGSAPAPTATDTEAPDTGTSVGTGSAGDSTTAPADTTAAATSRGTTDEGTTTITGTTGPGCGVAIGECEAVDVLFVVDNSGSMEDDNAQLIPAFANVDELVGNLVDGPCTYHLGVTTTEIAPDFQPARCQQRGALSRAGAICDPWADDPEHPPWVSETDSLNLLGCLLAVGTNYDTDEKQLQTVLEALGDVQQGPGGCNEGFMREGVPLIVVLITDEDDDDDSADPFESPERTGSAGGPNSWWNELTAIKDPSELGMVVLASTDPGTCDPWTPASGLSDGDGAEYAERLLTFLQFFTGAGFSDHFRVVDICQSGPDIVAEVAQVETLLANVCLD
ncbi:MAG: vWA domain-containing protein [Nannocystaceae bacterium]